MKIGPTGDSGPFSMPDKAFRNLMIVESGIFEQFYNLERRQEIAAESSHGAVPRSGNL